MNVSMPLTVLFFGPSGVGKGTQVQKLIDIVGQEHTLYIDMGARLRAEIARGTLTGTLTDDIIGHGGLMPGFMPIYIMTKAFADEFNGTQHIIADGVVRRTEQAEAWDDAMKFYSRTPYHVIVLDLPEDIIVQRLLGRGRKDDTLESIHKRLSWYKTEVLPSFEVLEARGALIHHIDGTPDPDTVHASIRVALGI